MNSNEPGSSGEAIAAANTQTTSQNSDATDVGKEAVVKDREAAAQEAAEREAAGHEAAGSAARQESGVEQVREVGASAFAVSPFAGGGGRVRRLLLIGLAGATPELALGAWRTELRTLHMLTDRGVRGRMRSSTPWANIPAWLSLLSGLDAGQTGIYGATARQTYSYGPPTPLDSHAMREPRIWDILGSAGKHVGVVGAPATTPAAPVYGHLIGDQVAAGESAIYPPALRQQVATWLEDDPPAPLAGDEIDRIVGSAYMRADQRFRLARRLLARDTYDCFVVYDDGIAAVQRALWDTLDTTHRRFRPNHPSAGVISAFYRFIDEQIADLLELIDDNTVVALVSACGTQALDGELALNDWLIDQGELVLHTAPARSATLAECDVDWAHTRAWAEADGAIYLNIAGRETYGSIPSAAADAAAENLAARLRGLAGPEANDLPHEAAGQLAAVDVSRPAALYSAARGIAPDLLAICTQPGWRPCELLGRGSPWVPTGRAPMDAACDSPSGLFVIYDPHHLGHGRELAGATIYDIVPTILTLLDQPIPARLRGRALLEE